jgi:hypothetical protein
VSVASVQKQTRVIADIELRLGRPITSAEREYGDAEAVLSVCKTGKNGNKKIARVMKRAILNAASAKSE